ncbi:hypothetical protein SAMN05444817_10973 [Corynebacterium appendicis CIP 107643]|uniref:Uncharacterized protein n=1 Tax=Corynebacterium appendicis CIP 107643 TaxID=1161099 RepID=A0A1N7JLZ3_9CORY|nr:hypothetical protein [Corynebacterium appendicis]WJY61593.1 hypothetical protein CAPP_08435 [Corynebacterium appendicis CIP 107643]SIS50325.1 hypothetical protein SAMN05444817_10973 [Corynebacterium appendicis CIP 107643]
MTLDPATPHDSDNTSADSTTFAKTVVISRPVHSIADLGVGIIDAIYSPDEPAATSASPSAEPDPDPGARPVPRNLDALADLLRETQTDRLVVTDWRASEELTGKLLNVFSHEGVTLVRG